MIKVRVDDFPAATPDEWLDLGKHTLLHRLEEREIPYYLGITPLLIDAEHAEYLHTLKYANFALHGFDHGFSKWRPQSEFDGMTEEQIEERLVEAWARLLTFDLVTVDNFHCFVPPFNHFNQAVVDVLLRTGFDTITGGPETFSQMDVSVINFRTGFHGLGLRFLPSTGERYTSHGDLNHLLNQVLPACPDNELVTMHLTGRYT